MFDLLRENEGAVQEMPCLCQTMLGDAGSHLKVLDSEKGSPALIQSLAAEKANIREMLAKTDAQEGLGG